MHIIQLFLKTTIIWKKNTGMFKSFLFAFVLQVIIKSPFHGMTGEVPAAKRRGTILQ